jgi:hypothetical protein
MKTLYNLLIIIFLSSVIFTGCDDNLVNNNSNPPNPSPQTHTHSPHYAAHWMDLLYNTVAAQDIPPPRAARIYGYGAITIYECVRYGMPSNYSLSGQLNAMPSMPTISLTDIYDWPSVVAGAMPLVVRGILDTVENITNQRLNNLKATLEQERRNAVGNEIVDRSITYGESVGNKIIEWSRTDGYIATRTMTYNIPPRTLNPAYWEPTDPAHPSPLEPFWGTLRPFAMPNPRYCDVPPSFPFDSTENSLFYIDALEVKTVRETLTPEQREIAVYWQDKLRTGTPPGHWVSIMNQVVGIKNLNLASATEMYTLCCIAMSDAFISCWESKFRYNLLRPQTYIRDYIPGGENWNSFLACPVFPTYTSGHSTQSASASYVLTRLFGAVSFTDTAIASLGFTPRSFTSFDQARDEAVVSRLYGGIHYRFDNELGVTQGIKIGETVFQRVRLRP